MEVQCRKAYVSVNADIDKEGVIVLRERSQQIVKPLIGSLKNLLMQTAAEFRYIRKQPDQLHIL